jgi:predicted amino acid dehydrogenase
MDAKDMIKNRNLAEKKIIKAARFAEKLGVGHIGLGALSASFTKNGHSLEDKVDCLVTTGHSLTAWVVSQNAIEIQRLSGKRLVLAIVGAGGSMGSSCFGVLEDHFDKFILIDKDLKRLGDKINLAQSSIIKYSSDIKDIYSADVIITVTNAPYAIINDSQQLSKGTVVIDDAQPINASRDVNSKERKTLVIEGGVCHKKDLHYNLDLNLLDKGDMFSCMGELITLSALDSDFVTIGDTNKNKVLKIAKLAESIGIQKARFRSFGEPINESYIKTLF